MDWNARILEQFTWHWQQQARPRLDGLTDEEYLWEPAPNSWSIRPGGIDCAYPAPEPAPVTTIAWRFGHLLVGVFGGGTAAFAGVALTMLLIALGLFLLGPRPQLRPRFA